MRRSDADYSGIIPPDDFVLPWGDITIPINPQIREILPYPEVDLDVDFVRVFYTTAEDEAKIAPALSEFKVDFINVYEETIVRGIRDNYSELRVVRQPIPSGYKEVVMHTKDSVSRTG